MFFFFLSIFFDRQQSRISSIFFARIFLGLNKFDDFVSRECEQEEESMNPCICLLTWPIGTRANVPGGGNNSIINLHVACTTVGVKTNRATCLVFSPE